jgi:alanine racemase
MIDVTGISGVVPGDEVTLVGRSGELFIAAAEVAEAAQTIPHEFLCQIGKRVPRVYVDVEQEDE